MNKHTLAISFFLLVMFSVSVSAQTGFYRSPAGKIGIGIGYQRYTPPKRTEAPFRFHAQTLLGNLDYAFNNDLKISFLPGVSFFEANTQTPYEIAPSPFVLATNHRPLSDWVYQYATTDAHPVVGVSWEDARAYAKWTGKRLPTEAEWEKAARGGLVQKNYSWGDAAVDGTQCNFADKNLRIIWNREREPEDNWADENLDDGYAYTAPVGSYPPNGYGLYDMVGNVWEWCFDAYDENFYTNSPYENPIAEILIRDGASNIVAVNKLRVTRGTSWYDGVPSIWIASRLGQSPETQVTNVGFRCVQSVTP